jgi:hypothetical protein
MQVPSVRASGALYQVVLPSDVQKQVMADLQGKNINHGELLPDPDALEKLGPELDKALKNSQRNCGHFQWKLEVRRQIELRGLRAWTVDK